MPSFGFILMFVTNTKINFIITLIVVLLLFSIAIIFIFCFTRNINYLYFDRYYHYHSDFFHYVLILNGWLFLSIYTFCKML